MSHTPGDTTTNDELLHRIDLVGEHLKLQDAQLADVRNEQTTVRLEQTAARDDLSVVTQRVDDNFKAFDARLLPLEQIAATLDKLEQMMRWACRTGAAAIVGAIFKVVIDHFLH